MPGSSYNPLANVLASWIKNLPEANINTKTSDVKRAISSVSLSDNESLVSLDVVSLFTNVPVTKAMQLTADLIYSQPLDKQPPVNKAILLTLLELSVCNILIATPFGYTGRLTVLLWVPR